MEFADILGNPGVTLGSVTIGTIIVALIIMRWWKKSGGKKTDGEGTGRSWKALVGPLIAWCYGMLAVLASPGVSAAGIVTKLGLWGGNQAGYAYLVWGVGGTSPTVTRAQVLTLTPGGYAVYAIWTALMVGNYVWSKKLPRKQSIAAALAGILMGLSAGVAGVAASPLGSAVNALGAWYTGAVQ